MSTFGNVSVSRMIQLNAQAAHGGEMPDDLSPDEQRIWRDAVNFHEIAEEEGLTVALPHETA
jgi:hypothetical protein